MNLLLMKKDTYTRSTNVKVNFGENETENEGHTQIRISATDVTIIIFGVIVVETKKKNLNG